MNDETKSRFQVKTEVVVVKDEGERSLEVSVDQTGAYIRTPEHGASLPVDILRDALERAGVLEARAAPVTTLLERDRDSWKAHAERCHDDIAALEKERDTHKTNAETLARDLAEARAEVERLRSLAGSPEMGRVLTADEVEVVSDKLDQAHTGVDALRWLERMGYLSVRLPSRE